MKQYIDKTALVAEIERILSIYTKRYDELAKYHSDSIVESFSFIPEMENKANIKILIKL